MQVLMIGCGKMGSALLEQWVKADNFEFTIITRSSTSSLPGVVTKRGPEDIKGQTFDIIVIGVKPQMIDDVMPPYAEFLADDGCVLSMAAGYAIGRIKDNMNGAPVVRVMPNLPSAIGAGVSGLVASDDTNDTQRSAVDRLMDKTGTNVWVESEDAIDRVTAVAGSGPGYVFEIARTYVEAAKSLGFSQEQARDLVLGTLSGTIEMAIKRDEDLETLRNSVTSKNGTTEAGLNALNGDGSLTTLLKKTVDAAYSRAVELR